MYTLNHIINHPLNSIALPICSPEPLPVLCPKTHCHGNRQHSAPPRHPGKVSEHTLQTHTAHVHTKSYTQNVCPFLWISVYYGQTKRSLPDHSWMDKQWNKNSFTKTRWHTGGTTVWTRSFPHTQTNSFHKYVPLHIKIEVVFSISGGQLQPELFSMIKSVPNNSSVQEQEVERGAEREKRRKLVLFSVPDNPPSSVSLPSDLSDTVSWNSDSWRGCGREGNTKGYCQSQ